MERLWHQLIAGPAGEPEQLCVLLHGVFGMGTNFRTLATRLAAALPGWGMVLVDLRGHGQSQGFDGPHTLAAAARDVLELRGALPAPVRAISGHSFGGKVALATLQERPGWVETGFVLDSDPGASPSLASASTVLHVLTTLEELPRTFAAREDFQRTLEQRGFSPMLVAWLSMNVRRDRDSYSLRLDLPAIRAMLEDYRDRDLWSVVETSVSELHFLLAGEGSALSSEAKARCHALAARAGRFHVHSFPKAGHWLHVDDPEGIFEVLRRVLSQKPLSMREG
jgi:pimeloyl-ACP methyl ester carboxylesterase